MCYIFLAFTLLQAHLISNGTHNMIKRSHFSMQAFRRLISSIVVFLFLLFCFTGTSLSQKPTATEKEQQSTTEKGSTNRNISNLLSKTTTLSKKLLKMHSELSALQNTDEVEAELLKSSEQYQQLSEQLKILLSTPHANYEKLTGMQQLQQEIGHKVTTVTEDLDKSLAILDKWIDFWSTEETDHEHWVTDLGTSNSLPEIKAELDHLLSTIKTSQQSTREALLPLLKLRKKAGNLQVSLYDLHLQIEKIFENKIKRDFHKQAPFLFSSDFVEQFNKDLLERTMTGIQRTLQPNISYLIKERGAIIVSLLCFLIVLTTIISNRPYFKRSTHWQFIGQRPLSVSLFMSLLLLANIGGEIPIFWLAIFRLITLVCVLRISLALITDKAQKSSITRLSLLLLVTDLMVVVNLPIPLVRLYMIGISLLLLTYYSLQERNKEKMVTIPVWWWVKRLLIIIFIIILCAEIIGRSEMAFFIFSASLKTLFACLSIWVLFLILSAIFEITLHVIPLALLQKKITTITSMLRPILIFGCVGVLFSTILVDWHVFSTPDAAMNYIDSLGIGTGADRISIGLILTALFLLYAAYCTSRMIQSILLQSILPRKNVDKGVQLSITRLLHYGIMLIGFMLALRSLGFDLTNLTILGGALGVGIGFGLQAIVNNFASGLILLFERPIKVGDTIQVGDELAEVKELGLRATIVQTYDNAEIVLPNSDLITSQVTNWTLKERRVRVKIPVGVAYGSDVEKVLKILLECASERPDVLSTPNPSALFLAFGSSSLDFELRVFIPEFMDRRRVQSELNLDINREFTDAGIEIPFPQSDLHLRSVDADAAKLFSSDNKV